MALFESALTLLAISILLLFAARRLGVPYPGVLALAGAVAAALPWARPVGIDPRLALALFVAPAVMDSAFDMPPRILLRHWLPLISLAVLLVLVTTGSVAWVAWAQAGLPVAAAVALGAIVAPPDTAAAAAVLDQFKLPRRTVAVLQGESLLNDAVVLLIFGAAIGAASEAPGNWFEALPPLLVAVPAGGLLGVAIGALNVYLVEKFAGTLSSIIVQVVATYGAWVIADQFHLSSIVAVATLAMVVAHYSPSRTSAKDRVSANAVWAALVFVLNVLAFLLVGLQARVIVAGLEEGALWEAIRFASGILGVVIVVRVVWVLGYVAVIRRWGRPVGPDPLGESVPSIKLGVLVSWCGMRGLVTLATALALPPRFPGRDLIVLTAFVVVFGTLVFQGFTIRPLIAVLGIEPDCSLYAEMSRVRTAMLDAALQALTESRGDAPEAVRAEYMAARAAAADPLRPLSPTIYDELHLEAVACQRQVLDRWRRSECIDDDVFHCLEEELDRAELHARKRDRIRLQKA